MAAARLISHLQAVQIAAVAEFASPGRCGNLDELIDGLVDHTGLATRLDGSTDDVALQCRIVERAQSMAAAEISAAIADSYRDYYNANREYDDQLDQFLDAEQHARHARPRRTTVLMRLPCGGLEHRSVKMNR